MKKYLSIVIIIMLVTIIALPVYAENEVINVRARVIENKGIEEIEKENEPTKKVQNLKVRILEGEYENEEYEMQYMITEDTQDITSNIELKEEDEILVALEEKEGEVTKINYIETIDLNYSMYVVAGILLIILLIISRKRATLIYLVTIILTSSIIIFSLQMGWNLIIVSSILSFLITVILFISINKINKETLIMIIRAVLGIAISGILAYILFDIMNLESINIKVTDKFVNIKDLISSATILFSQGIYNSIAISGQYIFYANNKSYKTKSDNIIEGQRSLKL